MIDKRRLIRLTQDLIRLKSENPPGDTRLIAKFVAGKLKRLGLEVKTYEFKKKVINIAAKIKGDSKRSLIISPHLDTVPAGSGWRHPAFAGKIVGNKIYGCGATDCKANVAVALEAVNSLVEEGTVLDYNLILLATSDEETGSRYGLIPLLDRKIVKAESALILDSDDFDIIVAQKGLIHFMVKIFGKKAHGAYPWRGVNAIESAAKIITELKKNRFIPKQHSLLKPPTINIGKISGGDKVNIVADYCEFEVDLRFLPRMDPSRILGDIKSLIKEHSRKFKIEIQDIQKPYQIPRQHSLVESLKRSAKKFGINPEIKGSEGATVITFFQKHGIPAVATGFGSRFCAHTSDEYAKINNLYRGALVLENFLKNY